MRANRELWADRATSDLLAECADVTCRVTLISGADDPRPWTATDDVVAALPVAERIVLDHAGHLPWYERPEATRNAVLTGLRG